MTMHGVESRIVADGLGRRAAGFDKAELMSVLERTAAAIAHSSTTSRAPR